jgi:hypothetical protein
MKYLLVHLLLAHLAKDNMSFCHHLSSVNFSHFNLLLWNPLAQWTQNLVGSIYGRSSIKNAHFVLNHIQYMNQVIKSSLHCLCLLAHSGVQHILCCVSVFCFSSSSVPSVMFLFSHMMPVSLDCSFFTAPSVFSSVSYQWLYVELMEGSLMTILVLKICWVIPGRHFLFKVNQHSFNTVKIDWIN